MSSINNLAPLHDSAPARGDQRLHIEGLVVPCSIGIHAHERGAPQRVRIDLVLTRAEPSEPTEDDVTKVVRYDKVIKRIKHLTGGAHINLVETLAERIADLCLAEFDVAEVRIKVCKLDVYDDVDSVGVEIVRGG